MGGQVIESLTDEFINRGKSEGKLLEKLSMIDKFVASGICSFEKACEVAEITQDEYEKLKQQLLEKKASN